MKSAKRILCAFLAVLTLLTLAAAGSVRPAYAAKTAAELEEEQKRYVASPLGILARGYVFRDSRARVFTVEEDGRVDFPRLSESLKLLRGWMG